MPKFVADVNEDSPHYRDSKSIMGCEHVPIRSPVSYRAILEGRRDADVFDLDVERLTEEQRSRLERWITIEFHHEPGEASAALSTEGFPICAADVHPVTPVVRFFI